MCIELSIGTRWNMDQIEQINSLNNDYSENNIRISEVYGSIQSSHIALKSARPDFRLSHCDKKCLIEFTQKADKYGININYAANAPLVDPVCIDTKKIINDLKFLEQIGINKITISNPLLISFATENTNLKIELSTIANAKYSSALQIYKDMGISSLCYDLYIQRDIEKLTKLNTQATKLGLKSKLIANEFCMFGVSPCDGILRTACYNHSALGGNIEKIYNNWPFGACHQKRANNQSAWLQARFILPQHLIKYKELTGINFFKITGRTSNDDFLHKIAKAYMSQNYNGNIIELWIDPGSPEMKHFLEKNNINSRELIKSGFFDKWFIKKEICDYSCNIECKYCFDKLNELR